MESITQYISVHWVSWVFGIISVLLSRAYDKLSKQLKAERARTNAINAGVLALLHDRLYQACSFYLKRKYCTLEDRSNLEYMFRPYKALGGNGTGEDLNRCLALPYEPGRTGGFWNWKRNSDHSNLLPGRHGM